MRKLALFTLLTLTAVSVLSTTTEVHSSKASTSSVVPSTLGLPSRTWVESYPALLRYASIPVLVPAKGSMTRINRLASPSTSDTLSGTVVDASRDGYQVTLAYPSLPPWSTQEPKFMGNQTTFSFAGAKATSNLATWMWLGLAPNTDFNHLPGLPVPLFNGTTGYLTYFRNITGNGGSSTTLTWKTGAYVYQVSVPIAAGSGGRTAALAMARNMTPLTTRGVQAVIAQPFHALAVNQGQKSPAYRDTVKLALDLSSLPKSLNETLPSPKAQSIPHTNQAYTKVRDEGTTGCIRWSLRRRKP